MVFRRRKQRESTADELAQRDVQSWIPRGAGDASQLTAWLSALISIGAGVYLLSHQGASGETSWFEVIARGMGAYFIGKGIFIGSTLLRQFDQIILLRRIVELAAWNHHRETQKLGLSEPSSGEVEGR